jgi:ABC-type multidrug transport system ATPase subunit
LLEVRDILKDYGGRVVLDKISFEFYLGKSYGLVGKNGAGKTTFLKILMRLIRDHQGDIFLHNNSLTPLDYLKIPMAFISDMPSLYSDLTVKEHLLLICRSQKIAKIEALQRIDEIFEALKLEQYRNYFPDALSKGTLQRLNIAMGMVRDTSIFIMDEPFAALDPVQVLAVENLINLKKQNGNTFIISSHDLDSLVEVCDECLVLRDGKTLHYQISELTKEKITTIIGDSYGD